VIYFRRVSGYFIEKIPEEEISMNEYNAPRLFSVKEAARYLGMSEAALRKRIYLREVRGLVKIGGRIFLDRKELDRWIEEKRINGGKSGQQ